MITFSLETIDGIPVSAGVTRNGKIMVELSDDSFTVTEEDVAALVKASGFNTCFSLDSKRDFAEEYASFARIVVRRDIWSESGDFHDWDEVSLSELKDESVFREFFEGAS